MTTSVSGMGTSAELSDSGPFGSNRTPPRSRSHPWLARIHPHPRRTGRLVGHRENLIRVTVAEQALEMFFQPIFDLRTGGVVGVEALARFARPPIRPPDVWFTEAAAIGLGVDLEVIALHLALDRLSRLPAGLYLSLNASVETIASQRFRDLLDGVPAERIVLELTEHTPVDDYARFKESVEKLRSRGVRLAVDDAGAGFSSLRHVLDLQPEVIKLDIALIRGIDRDPARQALGRALIAFAKEAYEASVVAEGIETMGELQVLRHLGCPCGQGFYLGRPERMHRDLLAPAVSGQFRRCEADALVAG
jgi:EAL domain-containing protein (putative c-di-GMP-specific phosphodiesterase class I)